MSNEKLIEEARDIVRSWDMKGSWTADSPVGMLALLADALEAAEKAHTPTDDEREALAALIDPDSYRSGCSAGAHDVRDQLNGLYMHQEHAEIRRAETMNLISHGDAQGEPSDAQRLWAVISEAQARFRKYASQEAPTYDEEVDALLDISRILSRASEPQDNDAQVEAAAREINLIFIRTDTSEFGAGGWDRLYREMAVAALRAASAVTEQGEGQSE